MILSKINQKQNHRLGKEIAIRADGSQDIGIGHIMRCLTLADGLTVDGAVCHFVVRHIPQTLRQLIVQKGHLLHELPAGEIFCPRDDDTAHAAWLGTSWETDASHTRELLDQIKPSWLILDHYALDARWETQVLPSSCRLMVIDDLVDRSHIAHLLLDQNVGRTESSYKQLVPEDCEILLGPQYVLLRPEFARLRAQSLSRRQSPHLEHILITMGGADKDNITGWLLDCIEDLDFKQRLTVTVVLGASASHAETIHKQAAKANYRIKVAQNVTNMAELMVEADLCLGAAGSTAWERACLGLPSIIFSLADNQRGAAETLSNEGYAYFIPQQRPDDMKQELLNTLQDYAHPYILKNASSKAAALVNGSGTAIIRQKIGALS